jgi:indole-3-glycerol phosphate synthase
MSSSFLERIVAHKRRELANRRAEVSETALERLAADAPASRLSAGSPRHAAARPEGADVRTDPAGGQAAGAAAPAPASLDLFSPDHLGVMAEVKRASPSRGAIALDMDAVDQARGYVEGKADAISVLTDEEFYRGSLDDLRAIRAAVSTPVMRKDFILDRYGLLEARAAGADLVLLIVAVLGRVGLPRLMRETAELGMVALVETYTQADAELALEAGASLIGVNNRDLRTFDVSLETTERLAPLLAPHATVVSLSGIHTADDARRVVAAGARAVLVGEALVRAPDPAGFIRELRAVPVAPRAPGHGRPSPPTPRFTEDSLHAERFPISRARERGWG